MIILTGSIPRNYTQAKNTKRKLGLTPGSSNKGTGDPLLTVLELQKSTFQGFIREVVCNDLPTITLFTDWQMEDLIKFCCHKKPGMISELGVDVTFQLGPFYVVVTTYKNTLFTVKGATHSPCCIGPIFICMTKEESTYLSFIHCLLREVPGLCQYLHVTGTDNEAALRNAIAAGMSNAHPLLCYLHSQRNVKAKLQQLGISQSLNSKICHDIYAKNSGLLWADSKEEFDKRVTVLLQEWEALEASERTGPPKFADYFRKFKLDDMRERMAKFVMKDLGLESEPYHQNVPESLNHMLKQWNNFVPQDLDKFIASMYDFTESFKIESELTWFGVSDKWEVKQEYRKYMPQTPHAAMSSDERKSEIKKASKICPDPVLYKECHSFKFPSKVSSTTFQRCQTQTNNNVEFEDLAPLAKFFSEEELRGITEKARVALKNKSCREGERYHS